MKNKNNAFTFVELIVVITIITILGAIGFMNYIDSISDTRNSARISHLNNIKASLDSQKQDKAIYPLPSTPFNIINSGTIVARQGFINSTTLVTQMDNVPFDPYKKNEYIYSVTRQQTEIQLAATLENYGEKGKALLVGNYKTVSRNILPTIILAENTTNNMEIADGVGQGSINRRLFIFDNSINNLPYEFETGEPYTNGTDFNDLLNEALNDGNFMQNSNYKSCSEIQDENKNISSGYSEEYFIVENNALTSTGCTF